MEHMRDAFHGRAHRPEICDITLQDFDSALESFEIFLLPRGKIIENTNPRKMLWSITS